MIGAAASHLAGLAIGLPVGSAAGSAAIACRIAISFFRAAIVAAGARDVDFAADDGLHAARYRFVMEVLGGKKIAMIGDGHGGHAAVGRLVYQFRDVASAVEKTVIGVYVKMDETRCCHRRFILVAVPRIFQKAARTFATVFNRVAAASPPFWARVERIAAGLGCKIIVTAVKAA